ncbi:MAG: hypothetical protein COS99_03045, partial [Candidatus Omnitrophica bacterium CG07_land_8_20_14_0_80_42_15]
YGLSRNYISDALYNRDWNICQTMKTFDEKKYDLISDFYNSELPAVITQTTILLNQHAQEIFNENKLKADEIKARQEADALYNYQKAMYELEVSEANLKRWYLTSLQGILGDYARKQQELARIYIDPGYDMPSSLATLIDPLITSFNTTNLDALNSYIDVFEQKIDQIVNTAGFPSDWGTVNPAYMNSIKAAYDRVKEVMKTDMYGENGITGANGNFIDSMNELTEQRIKVQENYQAQMQNISDQYQATMMLATQLKTEYLQDIANAVQNIYNEGLGEIQVALLAATEVDKVAPDGTLENVLKFDSYERKAYNTLMDIRRKLIGDLVSKYDNYDMEIGSFTAELFGVSVEDNEFLINGVEVSLDLARIFNNDGKQVTASIAKEEFATAKRFGDRVFVQGTYKRVGSEWYALDIQYFRADPNNIQPVTITGEITEIETATEESQQVLRSLDLQGLNILVDPNTLYYDANGQSITRDEFIKIYTEYFQKQLGLTIQAVLRQQATSPIADAVRIIQGRVLYDKYTKGTVEASDIEVTDDNNGYVTVSGIRVKVTIDDPNRSFIYNNTGERINLTQLKNLVSSPPSGNEAYLSVICDKEGSDWKAYKIVLTYRQDAVGIAKGLLAIDGDGDITLNGSKIAFDGNSPVIIIDRDETRIDAKKLKDLICTDEANLNITEARVTFVKDGDSWKVKSLRITNAASQKTNYFLGTITDINISGSTGTITIAGVPVQIDLSRDIVINNPIRWIESIEVQMPDGEGGTKTMYKNVLRRTDSLQGLCDFWKYMNAKYPDTLDSYILKLGVSMVKTSTGWVADEVDIYSVYDGLVNLANDANAYIPEGEGEPVNPEDQEFIVTSAQGASYIYGFINSEADIISDIGDGRAGLRLNGKIIPISNTAANLSDNIEYIRASSQHSLRTAVRIYYNTTRNTGSAYFYPGWAAPGSKYMLMGSDSLYVHTYITGKAEQISSETGKITIGGTTYNMSQYAANQAQYLERIPSLVVTALIDDTNQVVRIILDSTNMYRLSFVKTEQEWTTENIYQVYDDPSTPVVALKFSIKTYKNGKLMADYYIVLGLDCLLYDSAGNAYKVRNLMDLKAANGPSLIMEGNILFNAPAPSSDMQTFVNETYYINTPIESIKDNDITTLMGLKYTISDKTKIYDYLGNSMTIDQFKAIADKLQKQHKEMRAGFVTENGNLTRLTFSFTDNAANPTLENGNMVNYIVAGVINSINIADKKLVINGIEFDVPDYVTIKAQNGSITTLDALRNIFNTNSRKGLATKVNLSMILSDPDTNTWIVKEITCLESGIIDTTNYIQGRITDVDKDNLELEISGIKLTADMLGQAAFIDGFGNNLSIEEWFGAIDIMTAAFVPVWVEVFLAKDASGAWYVKSVEVVTKEEKEVSFVIESDDAYGDGNGYG